MPPFPAVCTNCGWVFPSGIDISGQGGGIVIEGPFHYPCPRCHRPDGDVPSGTYSVFGTLIGLTPSTAEAQWQLERILAVFQRAERGEITTDEAFAEAPSWVQKFRSELTDSPVAQVGFVIALVTFMLSGDFKTGVDVLEQFVPLARLTAATALTVAAIRTSPPSHHGSSQPVSVAASRGPRRTHSRTSARHSSHGQR